MKKKTLVVLTSLLLGFTSCATPDSVTPTDTTPTPTQTTNISVEDAFTISNEEISETTSEESTTQEVIDVESESTSTQDSEENSSKDENATDDSTDITSNNPDDNPGTSSVETEEETLISTYKFNGETFQYKNLKVFGTFEENKDGTLTLISVGDALNDDFIVIPSEVNGKTVTQYTGRLDVPLSSGKKIVIPPSLEHIWLTGFPQAFFLFEGDQKQWLANPIGLLNSGPGMIDLYLLENDEFTLVKDLVIENGVESIPLEKFSRCTITSLTTPSSLKQISSNAFAWCEQLSSIHFSEGLESILGGAFSQCDHLYFLQLPSTIKELGNSSFDCSRLLSLEVPAGLSITKGSIRQAFMGATSLYRFINNSAMSASFFSVKLTKDNDDSGAIFLQNGYYFGKFGNNLTLLLYIGEDKELHLPTSISYKEETFSSYDLGNSAFLHPFYMILDPSLGIDYLTQLPIISKLYIPSCVTAIGFTSLYHEVRFTDESHFMEEVYFDCDRNTFLQLIQYETQTPIMVARDLKMYYKESNEYVLFEEPK